MIDSVTLQMDKGFRIRNRKLFDGKVTKQVNKSFSVVSSFSNKAKELKKQGRYFPSVRPSNKTVKRFNGTVEKVETLEIQVSLSKLLYGCNIFDVDIDEYEEIVSKLVSALKELEIDTDKDAIKNAIVKRVDLAKVIKLPDYMGTAKQVIKKLSAFDFKPSSDFQYKQYFDPSDGISLKFWNKTQGYVVYDKISEIVGNGYTLFEQDVIKAVEEDKLKKHIIKFELSLQRKQSLEAVLKRHIPKPQNNYRLYDLLYNKKAVRDILLETFNKVYGQTNIALVSLSEMKENELEQYLVSRKLKPKTKGWLYYLVNKTTKIGVKGMWEELRRELRGGSFDRYKRDIAEILAELGEINGNTANLIGYLRSQHEQFEMIKPKRV